ncbi:MAG: GyrI-like domain-containing protein [Leptospira sp.]|nr:GyrI-like domain-containing protein [Leptospira sp.]
MDYKIIEKPSFEIIGKSKIFTHENFFKEAPKFWKDYVGTDEYKTLWNTNGGRSGKISEAPLMSVYIPIEKNKTDSFTDILGVELTKPVSSKNFKTFQIPSATYAEFYCSYQTSAKMNKQIYGEWLPSSGYERDIKKADIAAYFPAAFLPMTQMAVRWWIPVIKKSK